MESTSEGGDGGMMFVGHKKEGSLGGQLPEEGTFSRFVEESFRVGPVVSFISSFFGLFGGLG